MDGAKYEIFVRVNENVGKKFDILLDKLSTPIAKPSKTDMIELAIEELYKKYVTNGKKI